jgi:hypothetical protein
VPIGLQPVEEYEKGRFAVSATEVWTSSFGRLLVHGSVGLRVCRQMRTLLMRSPFVRGRYSFYSVRAFVPLLFTLERPSVAADGYAELVVHLEFWGHSSVSYPWPFICEVPRVGNLARRVQCVSVDLLGRQIAVSVLQLLTAHQHPRALFFLTAVRRFGIPLRSLSLFGPTLEYKAAEELCCKQTDPSIGLSSFARRCQQQQPLYCTHTRLFRSPSGLSCLRPASKARL